jgi:hypothetical protein
MIPGGVTRELILDLQSGLISRKIHSLCHMTSLILMLPPDKSLQGTASRASMALSTTWILAMCTTSIAVHFNRGETADDLPIYIPVF